MRLAATVATLAVAGFPFAISAQTTQDTLSLQGRSIIAVGVGLNSTHGASNTPGGQVATSNGVASLNFTHFTRPSVAFEISAAVLDASASNTFSNQTASGVTSLLAGVRYAPEAIALSTTLRPYVSVLVGPYFNNFAKSAGYNGTAMSESVFGSKLGAGTNWYMSRHLSLQLEASYDAIGHFEHEDVLSHKPGGFAMTAGFGVAWGGR